MPETSIHDRVHVWRDTVTYYTVLCSCGWVSDKWGNEEDAVRQHVDHVERCARVVIPFRKR